MTRSFEDHTLLQTSMWLILTCKSTSLLLNLLNFFLIVVLFDRYSMLRVSLRHQHGTSVSLQTKFFKRKASPESFLTLDCQATKTYFFQPFFQENIVFQSKARIFIFFCRFEGKLRQLNIAELCQTHCSVSRSVSCYIVTTRLRS